MVNKSLINLIVSGNLLESKKYFREILNQKVLEKLEQTKSDIKISESNGSWASAMLKHVKLRHPQQAFDRNLKDREKLEKKLDAVGTKRKRKRI